MQKYSKWNKQLKKKVYILPYAKTTGIIIPVTEVWQASFLALVFVPFSWYTHLFFCSFLKRDTVPSGKFHGLCFLSPGLGSVETTSWPLDFSCHSPTTYSMSGGEAHQVPGYWSFTRPTVAFLWDWGGKHGEEVSGPGQGNRGLNSCSKLE
jgi:hypothetical protein